jgi:hypothetical protein
MRNPFAIEEDPQNPVPREAFGWRIYAVAFGATWVLFPLNLLKTLPADNMKGFCHVRL